MVIFLERGADLRMAQLMPLPLSCFSKIQICFTFLVPAHPGSPEKSTINWVCVYVVVHFLCWWHGTVVERRSLAGQLSLSCARPAADG